MKNKWSGHKTLIIDSGVGTGKTQWIGEHILSNPDCTALFDYPHRYQ